LIREYQIQDNDFTHAGEASSNMKKTLTRLGVRPDSIKRAAIAMYEAEINAVIHAHGGLAVVSIYPDSVKIEIVDHGPGIPDIEQAMKEGYSTAPDTAREMGFGAGMGLPNMKKHADSMNIDTKVGKGTKVTLNIKF
jgi:anti-sigma regulatory factor (Ser/Thr protein kinase)